MPVIPKPKDRGPLYGGGAVVMFGKLATPLPPAKKDKRKSSRPR